MMKTIKIGLLTTAALVAISTMAYADGLSDLKAAIAALNTSAAISQAGVQLPSGYRVSPTADAAGTDLAVEEPFVEVKVSGYIKTGFIYSQVNTNGDAKAILMLKVA